MDEKKFKLRVYRIPLSELSDIEVYPPNRAELVKNIDGDIKYFAVHQ